MAGVEPPHLNLYTQQWLYKDIYFIDNMYLYIIYIYRYDICIYGLYVIPPPFKKIHKNPSLTEIERSSTLALDLVASDTARGTRQAGCHGTAGETSDVASVEGNDASGVAGTAADLDARLRA